MSLSNVPQKQVQLFSVYDCENSDLNSIEMFPDNMVITQFSLNLNKMRDLCKSIFEIKLSTFKECKH